MSKKEITKEERFINYANLRLNNAVKAIELLGNLSNKSSYEYSDKQVSTIFVELKKATDSAKARFEKVKSSSRKNGNYFWEYYENKRIFKGRKYDDRSV